MSPHALLFPGRPSLWQTQGQLRAGGGGHADLVAETAGMFLSSGDGEVPEQGAGRVVPSLPNYTSRPPSLQAPPQSHYGGPPSCPHLNVITPKDPPPPNTILCELGGHTHAPIKDGGRLHAEGDDQQRPPDGDHGLPALGSQLSPVVVGKSGLSPDSRATRAPGDQCMQGPLGVPRRGTHLGRGGGGLGRGLSMGWCHGLGWALAGGKGERGSGPGPAVSGPRAGLWEGRFPETPCPRHMGSDGGPREAKMSGRVEWPWVSDRPALGFVAGCPWEAWRSRTQRRKGEWERGPVTVTLLGRRGTLSQVLREQPGFSVHRSLENPEPERVCPPTLL